jgi:hypothetical protein
MKIRVDNVRFSQVYVHKLGKKFDENGKEKYSVHGIIDRDSPASKQVQAAILAAAKEQWGTAAEAKLKAIKAAGKIWCLREGDSKLDKDGNVYPEYAGKLFVSAKNEIRPSAFGPGREALTAEDDKPYAGSYGSVLIDIRAGDKPSAQVYAYLLGVQFIADGERLAGGGVAAADDFEAIPGTEAAAGSSAPAGGAASLF